MAKLRSPCCTRPFYLVHHDIGEMPDTLQRQPHGWRAATLLLLAQLRAQALKIVGGCCSTVATW